MHNYKLPERIEIRGKQELDDLQNREMFSVTRHNQFAILQHPMIE